MIQSMTGYAVAAAASPRGALSLELRTVNARFLDLQFRIADELRPLEPLLRERIVARIARGKIDCRLSFSDEAGSRRPQTLNPEAVARLRSLAEEARKAIPDAAPLRLADVLRWPGVVAEATLDDADTRATVERLAAQALDDLLGARAREGARLAASVRQRVLEMRRRLEEVAPLVPQALAAYKARLAERLREAIGSADEDRIRAELAVFGAKIDVDEEFTRLGAHLAEVERALERGGAIGKRLDFLAQELNREANTLASKAASQKIADCALELKLLVEQIREQVQNIE